MSTANRRTALEQLSQHGRSVWIDSLSRDLLDSGEFARMIEQDAVVGVTSNPTIFRKAISQGDRYDEQLKELLEEESDAKEVFYHLTGDIDAATDLLRPAWDASGGYVSWEVDPTLAYDRGASVAEARRPGLPSRTST